MALSAVRPTTPGDVGQMQRRADVLLTPAQLTRARTFWAEEVPLCCWGVTEAWPGLGLAWFLETQPWAGHPLARRIAKAVWQTWHGWRRDFRYVEALVAAERDDSRRLVEWLGFDPTVTKPGYGPGGETMIEYRWMPTGILAVSVATKERLWDWASLA